MRMPNAQFPPPALTHKANDFSLCLREDWKDKTLYTIIGPVTDYIQHNIIISVDKEVQVSTLHDYADRNVNSVLGELKARRLLKQDEIKIVNGMPAYRAIFSWWPRDDMSMNREKVYLLAGMIGYKLTASFTKKTR